MIGYLKGTVSFISSQTIILLVNNVGYEIYLPIRNLQSVEIGKNLELFIYTYVKEDQLKLFGFEDIKEKEMFIMLLNISGVGPKAAMAILSSGSIQKIHQAIVEANLIFFTEVKGLGKKTAQKIIIELKSKLGSIKELDLKDTQDEYSSDVILALQSFGFAKKEILTVLDKLDSNLSDEDLIRESLKYLGH